MAANRRASRRRTTIHLAVLVGVVAALFVIGRFIDVAEHVGTIQQWVADFGIAGPLVYTLGYTCATLMGVPGTPLTVLAALVFGPRTGVLVMIVASTLSAALGFVIARWIAREQVERLLGGTALYEALQRMLETAPGIAVPFTRLLPIFPFSLVNYGFGLSRMPMWKYLLASEIVMVPMNFVWVFSATAVYGTVIRGEVPWTILLWTAGAAVALLVVGVVGHRALGHPPQEAAT